jgi:hypothetical protein
LPPERLDANIADRRGLLRRPVVHGPAPPFTSTIIDMALCRRGGGARIGCASMREFSAGDVEGNR